MPAIPHREGPERDRAQVQVRTLARARGLPAGEAGRQAAPEGELTHMTQSPGSIPCREITTENVKASYLFLLSFLLSFLFFIFLEFFSICIEANRQINSILYYYIIMIWNFPDPFVKKL
jgi:hypothetical protein